jgi:hypothetical protein
VAEVSVRNVVFVIALALASWLGAEFVLDTIRVADSRPVPPIVLDVREDRPERKGKRSDRDTVGGGSPSSPSGGQPASGAEPAPPPPPPPAGEDDDDDDDDGGGGGDTDDGDDSDD